MGTASAPCQHVTFQIYKAPSKLPKPLPGQFHWFWLHGLFFIFLFYLFFLLPSLAHSQCLNLVNARSNSSHMTSGHNQATRIAPTWPSHTSRFSHACFFFFFSHAIPNTQELKTVDSSGDFSSSPSIRREPYSIAAVSWSVWWVQFMLASPPDKVLTGQNST